jgi:ankyrin repeat protein
MLPPQHLFSGHVGIARLLLSKGASVDVSSSEGTPLHVAASNGKSSIVQILLEHHANVSTIISFISSFHVV